MRIFAKEAVDPEQYREEHGRCPRGYKFDGEKCVPAAPKGEPRGKGRGEEEAPPEGPPAAEEAPKKGGRKAGKPKAPAAPKKAAKPKKPKVVPRGPTDRVTKDNPYGLSKEVRGAKTLADLGGHEAITKILGHMEPHNRPPPDVDPKDVELRLEGDTNGHSIMKWKDAKGRPQSAYTQTFMNRNAAVKWDRVQRMEKGVEKAIARFRGDMMDESLDEKERDGAACMAIIAATALRPGSRAGVKKTGNRGVTTLTPEHIKIDGDTIEMEFVGKSNKVNKRKFKDPELARFLKEKMEGKGKDEFLFESTERDLARTMKTGGLKGFKPKDFRTRDGCKTGADALAKLPKPPPPVPDDPKKAKKLIEQRIKEASAVVAERLGNTPAVARSSYINPALFKAWAESVGAEQYVTAAAGELSGEELFKKALETDVPGAGPIELLPDEEDDDALDSAPMPTEPEKEVAEAAVTFHIERIVAGLVAANHRDLAGLLIRTVDAGLPPGVKKMADQAAEQMRLLLGGGGRMRARDEQRLHDRVMALVDKLAMKTGMDRDTVWSQIENEARRRGPRMPMPGKDF